MQLRDDLMFAPQTHRGEVFYHIESAEKAAFIESATAEYVFVSLLDGQTTFAEALALTAQPTGSCVANHRAGHDHLPLAAGE